MVSYSSKTNPEDAYANLSLNNEEEEGLILGDIPDSVGRAEWDKCLVGYFLTSRKVNFMAMQDTLASI